MERTLMRQRVLDARVARLGTVTAELQPHLVPCCFALDVEVVYTAVDDVKAKSTKALRRLDNIRTNPRATMLVDHYSDDWSALWWVRLDGVAVVVDALSPRHPRGTGLLEAKYEQYAEKALTGTLIAIDITQWRGWP